MLKLDSAMESCMRWLSNATLSAAICSRKTLQSQLQGHVQSTFVESSSFDGVPEHARLMSVVRSKAVLPSF
jgi:hypothetical protein